MSNWRSVVEAIQEALDETPHAEEVRNAGRIQRPVFNGLGFVRPHPTLDESPQRTDDGACPRCEQCACVCPVCATCDGTRMVTDVKGKAYPFVKACPDCGTGRGGK